MRVVAMAAALIILSALFEAQAKDDRSLTDFESQTEDSRQNSLKSDASRAAAWKEKLLLAETTINSLSDTVAQATDQAETSRRELAEANLRLEALGVSDRETNGSQLETQLIQALRELRVLKENNIKARNQLLLLSESVQVLLQTSEGINPQCRMNVETELRQTIEILGSSPTQEAKSSPPSLSDAIVIETKAEISLVVANVGKSHGVKVGMPFNVLRDGKVINQVKVVDVREKISGAVIQNLTSEAGTVRRGDILKVDSKK
jgi:hypothetical protein